MNYSVDWDGPGERDGRSLGEIIADLDAVAENFRKGWRAEPPTMAALFDRVVRELRAIQDSQT